MIVIVHESVAAAVERLCALHGLDALVFGNDVPLNHAWAREVAVAREGKTLRRKALSVQDVPRVARLLLRDF